MKDMGKIMGILKKDHGDVLDFSKVSKIIKDLLNNEISKRVFRRNQN